MKKIECITGSLPEKYRKNFEVALFNCHTHRQLQSSGTWHSFFLADHTNQTILAQFHACEIEDAVQSPVRAPWGGLDFNPHIHQEDLHRFTAYIVAALKNSKEIRITSRPSLPAGAQFSMESYAFLQNGFEVFKSELHSVLPIKKEGYKALIRQYELGRRLRRTEDLGLQFTPDDVGKADEIYQFIANYQHIKGRRFSMDKSHFDRHLQLFPEDFLLFSVTDQDRLVAASICIRATSTMMHDFSHAHNNDYDKLSPVAFLFNGIYNYCLQNGLHYLDIGSSAIGQEPNFPLMTFKERAGGQPALKITWQKKG